MYKTLLGTHLRIWTSQAEVTHESKILSVCTLYRDCILRNLTEGIVEAERGRGKQLIQFVDSIKEETLYTET